MAQLSERLNRLSPSETLAMSQKSSELKAQGIDIINMSVGEPTSIHPITLKKQPRKPWMITSPDIHLWLVIRLCEMQSLPN